MKNKLTYVASGTSHFRLPFKEHFQDLEHKAWVNDTFQRMQVNPKHTFGILYNAWTEANFGPIYNKHFKDNLEVIQSDSGGLQVVTQGKTITEEIKKEVYLNQGSYSKMAMSFDDIPVAFTGKSSGRGDTTNRWFDKERFEECARNTGKNVFEQIKLFLDMKSETLPIFISQGNDYDTYMRWIEYAFDEIPQEYRKYISGIAMGAAALGQGPLEDVKRAFYYSCLPEHGTNHIHILGVGSISRMIPNLIFLQNGLFKDVYLTYDSTSHSSGLTYGRYYLKTNFLDIPKHFNKKVYNIVLEDVQEMFDLNCSLDEFYQALNMSSEAYKEKHGSKLLFLKIHLATSLKSCNNFMKRIDACLASKDELMSVVKNNVYYSLYQVKTLDDFNYWIKHCSPYIESQAVSPSKQSNLEDLFA